MRGAVRKFMPNPMMKTWYTVIAGYAHSSGYERPSAHYVEADSHEEAEERVCNSMEMLGDPIVYAVFEDIYDFKFRTTSEEVYRGKGITPYNYDSKRKRSG